MKHFIPLTLVLAVGCGTQQADLRYTSTLQARTTGVVLSEDGLDSFAAMAGTTCKVDTNWGCPIADADLPSAEERVVDFHGGMMLATSPEGVHTVSGQGFERAVDLQLADVKTARLTETGILAVAGDADCVVSSEGGSVEVPMALCRATSTSVDRLEGKLVIGAEDGVYRVDASGAERFAPSADLVTVDPNTGNVYTANRLDRVVRAYTPAGDELFTIDADGPIAGLAMRGDKGDVLVLVRDGEGSKLVRMSGENGLNGGEYSIPNIGGDLVVSGNGNKVGIVQEDEVHYYELSLAGEDAVIDPNVEVGCLDGWDLNSPGFLD